LDDDPSAFTPEDGAVRRLARRFEGAHLPKFPLVFDRLVRVTLLQVVTWQEACRSWERLVRELGEDAPGPLDVRVPPSVEKLRATPDYALIGLGIRPKQARTILRIAKYASRIEAAASSGALALATLLGALPGIGPWTIAYVQGAALGCPDAVLLGDYNLPHTVAYVLAGEPRGSEERMLELLEPYRGHRFRVIRLLWMNGVSAPRRGPRYQHG
jgi:3-methyladenine DNA glycosylase/8-oxoguanine DNA glycosylase